MSPMARMLFACFAFLLMIMPMVRSYSWIRVYRRVRVILRAKFTGGYTRGFILTSRKCLQHLLINSLIPIFSRAYCYTLFSFYHYKYLSLSLFLSPSLQQRTFTYIYTTAVWNSRLQMTMQLTDIRWKFYRS